VKNQKKIHALADPIHRSTNNFGSKSEPLPWGDTRKYFFYDTHHTSVHKDFFHCETPNVVVVDNPGIKQGPAAQTSSLLF
jgi:hypothetical protein